MKKIETIFFRVLLYHGENIISLYFISFEDIFEYQAKALKRRTLTFLLYRK